MYQNEENKNQNGKYNNCNEIIQKQLLLKATTVKVIKAV